MVLEDFLWHCFSSGSLVYEFCVRELLHLVSGKVVGLGAVGMVLNQDKILFYKHLFGKYFVFSGLRSAWMLLLGINLVIGLTKFNHNNEIEGNKGIKMKNLSFDMKFSSVFVTFVASFSCVLLFGVGISFAGNGKMLWEQHYGGGKRDKAFAIKSLPGGGSIVSGYTRSKGKGDSDVWVTRLDSKGKSLWEKTFGSPGREVSTAVTELKDHGFMVVSYIQELNKPNNRAAWLIRLDKNGKKIWDRKYYGAKYGRPYAVLAMPDGGAVVAGLTFQKDSSKFYEGWVFRVDKTGKQVWERIIGSKGKDWFRSVAALPNGDIVVVGAQQYHVVKAAMTVGGSSKHVTQAAWVVRLKPDGKTVWDKTFFNSENVARSVAVQKNGHIAVAGWTRGQNQYGKDTWIISLDGKGQKIWKKSFGGAGEDKFDAITILPDGSFALAGITKKHLPMMTVNKAWILSVDSKGKLLWEYPFGNGRADYVHAITTLSDGRIAVAGGTWRAGTGTDAWVFALSGKIGKKTIRK